MFGCMVVAGLALAACGAPADGPPDGVETLLARAEQGDAVAQAAVGDSYLGGEGVAPDAAEAARWYRLAAEQGDPAGLVRSRVPVRDRAGRAAGRRPSRRG